MTPERLAATLERLRAAGGAPPADLWELTELMLDPAWLGHPDPGLRDELVYTTLAGWLASGAYTPEQLRRVLATATDERHLFEGLGARDGLSVLTRSFSVLLVPPVLASHRRHPFLEPDEVRALAQTVERYLLGERDLRGYHERLGWLHAVAHAADAVGSLARCAELDAAEVLRLLAVLRTAAASQHHAYAHGEDERLAQAMVDGLGRAELTAADRAAWLDGFRPLVQACAELGMPDGYARFMNVKHVLRALYFLVHGRTEAWQEPVAHATVALLEEFARL